MNGAQPLDITFYDQQPDTESLLGAVVTGLAARPKAIAPKFFYDRRGSELFDAICDLPEYYPTRTEIGILQAHAQDIAELAGARCLLIELGSGASKKVRLLLEALRPSSYLGIDISKDFLLYATRRLAADYPWLDVRAMCADFSQSLSLDYRPAQSNRLAFFPGSSIGNFEPGDAAGLLRRIAHLLGPDGALLIGVDLKKEPAILNAAYNDARGVTAAFNLNLLRRIRDELGADIDLNGFNHRAFYNAERGRIEMHLESQRAQQVRVGQHVFTFAAGETVHTENSYKYTVEEFQALAAEAGFAPAQTWTDADGLFGVHYLVRA